MRMRRTAMTALVAIMLLTAGCNGILDTGNSTSGDTPSTVPTTTQPETKTEPDQTSTPSTREQEYLDSGKEFTAVIARRMHNIHGMYITDRGFYRNNTVSISYRLDDETPLYKSMMNATQTIAVSLPTRTTTDPAVAMRNGRDGKVHRPEEIRVNIVDLDGEPVGSFEVNPETAVEYRLREFDADVFAELVVDTLELEQDVKRGDKEPGWYLNRSQLHDWGRTYAYFLHQEADPSETVFEKEFPLDGLKIDPGRNRVHYNVTWRKEEMGQAFISGEAALNKAYYITANRSWAMAPGELHYYFDRPGIDDVRGRMDLGSVLWIITRPKTSENLNAYYNMVEGEVVDDE